MPGPCSAKNMKTVLALCECDEVLELCLELDLLLRAHYIGLRRDDSHMQIHPIQQKRSGPSNILQHTRARKFEAIYFLLSKPQHTYICKCVRRRQSQHMCPMRRQHPSLLLPPQRNPLRTKRNPKIRTITLHFGATMVLIASPCERTTKIAKRAARTPPAARLVIIPRENAISTSFTH